MNWHSLLLLLVLLDWSPVCSLSMSTTASTAPLLVRQLRKTKTVAECLELVPENATQDVVLAALHVCGKHNDLGTAMKLLERHPSSESCRTLTISIAGKCGDYKRALKLLRSSPTPPSIASHHACLAACGKAKAWKECLDLYEHLDPSNRTSCTAGIVLTAMVKSNRGTEALDFFATISSPDLQSIFKTMTALIGMGDLEGARQFVEQHAPNEAMVVNRLTSAYARAGNWEMVKQLNAKTSHAPTFEPWNVLPKIGKGRAAYWKLGTYKEKNVWDLTAACKQIIFCSCFYTMNTVAHSTSPTSSASSSQSRSEWN